MEILNMQTDQVLMTAFDLDIKNYIDQAVKIRTEPILTRTLEVLNKVNRNEVNLRIFKDDYDSNRAFVNSKLQKFITLDEYKKRNGEFRKNLEEELSNMRGSILRLDDQQDDFDNKIKENKFELQLV